QACRLAFGCNGRATAALRLLCAPLSRSVGQPRRDGQRGSRGAKGQLRSVASDHHWPAHDGNQCPARVCRSRPSIWHKSPCKAGILALRLPAMAFSRITAALLVSMALGGWCTVNRLRDFRATTQAARKRELGLSDAEIKPLHDLYNRLGDQTWTIFWWQL